MWRLWWFWCRLKWTSHTIDNIVNCLLNVRDTLLQIARCCTWSRWWCLRRLRTMWCRKLILHSTNVHTNSMNRIVHLSKHGTGKVSTSSLQLIDCILYKYITINYWLIIKKKDQQRYIPKDVFPNFPIELPLMLVLDGYHRFVEEKSPIHDWRHCTLVHHPQSIRLHFFPP